MVKPLVLAAALLAGLYASSFNDALDPEAVEGFVNDMVQQHQFARVELDELFKQARLSPSILTAIARPAESKQWYQYRPIFLTENRISEGVSFWFRYGHILSEVERNYGVPREIIVAIIGVETFYGKRSGDYRVLDALATLAFNYPPRATFFRSELENYLLMTKAQGINPLDLTGSYAGAMGMPQFMPSSFRSFAVDYDKDNRIDIWSNPADAIASVGNYLKQHGWEAGQPVVAQAYLRTPGAVEPFRPRLGSLIPLQELRNAGITTGLAVSGNPSVGLLELIGEQVPEYWLTLKNFQVIQTYNRSALYAMAVHQLSVAIRNEYEQRMRLTGEPK